jgi:hypothetical protein
MRFVMLQALIMSFCFLAAHMRFWPYKFALDNQFRAASELHVFLIVAVSLAFKTDLDSPLAAGQWASNSALSKKHYTQDFDNRKLHYDWLLIITFLILIAAALLLTITLKIRVVARVLTSDKEMIDSRDLEGRMRHAYARFRLGLATDSDHKELHEFLEQIDANEHVKAGKALWRSKTMMAHMRADEMAMTLTHLHEKLPKSEVLGLHFTNLDACRLVLEESQGIRASNVGQLGGGVSICLPSLTDLGWKRGGGKEFFELVGRQLWGSKWHEVMPPPAPQGAHADWGKYHCKLECAFVLRIPSDDHKDQSRIVPGRQGVYIMPKSECIPGAPGDENAYLSNQRIEACFVLKSPSGSDSDTLDKLAQRAEAARVKVQSTRDANGCMIGVALQEIGTAARVPDVLEDNPAEPWCPTVSSCVALVGKLPDRTDSVLRMHKQLQQEQSAKQLWPENVCRFTTDEMEAALRQIDNELLHPYTLAFFYTSADTASRMCKDGPGIAASTQPHGGLGLRVSLRSPVDFGWVANAGNFVESAGKLLWGVGWRDTCSTSLEAVIVMGVPTSTIVTNAAWTTIPESLLARTSGGDGAYYANAHIKKVYVLKSSSLVVSSQPSGVHEKHNSVMKDHSHGKEPPLLPVALERKEPPALPLSKIPPQLPSVANHTTARTAATRSGTPTPRYIYHNLNGKPDNAIPPHLAPKENVSNPIRLFVANDVGCRSQRSGTPLRQPQTRAVLRP